MYPGEASESLGYDNSVEGLLAAIQEDAEVLGFGFIPISATATCPTNAYKVALVKVTGGDFHWYRQNTDGTWSHKLSYLPVTNLDADNAIIYNPETCNRNYVEYHEYDIFIGYYAVYPLNIPPRYQ